jgi:FtsZ-binding cell division protein ZapB
MESVITLVSGIDFKVRKLIEKVEILENENVKLQNIIEDLTIETNNQKHKIEEFQERIKVLKLAKSLTKEESRTEVKLKINELLREIDNCVRLLNK